VFGVTTASDDDQGDVVNMVNAAGLTAAAVRAALPALCGEIAQRAPAVSAKQVGGRRLYDLQRRGEAVEAPTALVRVDRLELTSFVGGEQAVAAVTVECGPGTYVRAIARDLGAALGVGAHLRALVRTRVGPYGLDDAVTPETLAALSPDERLARLVPPETAVAHLPALTVPAALREDLRCGRVLALTAAAAADAVALLGEDGRLLAIGEPASGGIHPRKVFV
jgi:tRNA pseudouridine55 synthase